jgi:hypothetical protein
MPTINGLKVIFQCVAALQQVGDLLCPPLAWGLQPYHGALRFAPDAARKVDEIGLFSPLLVAIERCGGNQFSPEN